MPVAMHASNVSVFFRHHWLFHLVLQMVTLDIFSLVFYITPGILFLFALFATEWSISSVHENVFVLFKWFTAKKASFKEVEFFIVIFGTTVIKENGS